MKTLSQRNYDIIMPSIREEDSFDPNDIFFWFEEQLYMEEADDIWEFLEWAHRTNKPTNSDIMELFKEYVKTKTKPNE